MYKSLPNCYFTKPIIKTIESAITWGATSFNTMDDIDQDTLINHCIDALGSDALNILASDENDLMKSFKRFMQVPGLSEGHDVAVSMRDTFAAHIADDMDEMFAYLSRGVA